jgi:hypothetical protein
MLKVVFPLVGASPARVKRINRFGTTKKAGADEPKPSATASKGPGASPSSMEQKLEVLAIVICVLRTRLGRVPPLNTMSAS